MALEFRCGFRWVNPETALVRGQDGTDYTVTATTCTCKGFFFQSKKRAAYRCKHQDAAFPPATALPTATAAAAAAAGRPGSSAMVAEGLWVGERKRKNGLAEQPKQDDQHQQDHQHQQHQQPRPTKKQRFVEESEPEPQQEQQDQPCTSTQSQRNQDEQRQKSTAWWKELSPM
jgi:hypothetical protein